MGFELFLAGYFGINVLFGGISLLVARKMLKKKKETKFDYAGIIRDDESFHLENVSYNSAELFSVYFHFTSKFNDTAINPIISHTGKDTVNSISLITDMSKIPHTIIKFGKETDVNKYFLKCRDHESSFIYLNIHSEKEISYEYYTNGKITNLSFCISDVCIISKENFGAFIDKYYDDTEILATIKGTMFIVFDKENATVWLYSINTYNNTAKHFYSCRYNEIDNDPIFKILSNIEIDHSGNTLKDIFIRHMYNKTSGMVNTDKVKGDIDILEILKEDIIRNDPDVERVNDMLKSGYTVGYGATCISQVFPYYGDPPTDKIDKSAGGQGHGYDEFFILNYDIDNIKYYPLDPKNETIMQ